MQVIFYQTVLLAINSGLHCLRDGPLDRFYYIFQLKCFNDQNKSLQRLKNAIFT